MKLLGKQNLDTKTYHKMLFNLPQIMCQKLYPCRNSRNSNYIIDLPYGPLNINLKRLHL